MVSLTKEEIERIRHVNEMKRRANDEDNMKLVYYSGANLVLLRFLGKNKWEIVDETGMWFDDLFEFEEIQ